MNKLEIVTGIKLDNIYCISLNERDDRRKLLEPQFKKLNIKVEYMLVDKHIDPIRGCLESHTKCVMDAKKNNYTNVLIMEDDIVFEEELIDFFINTGIKNNVPKNFDIFYLGYHGLKGYKHNKHIIHLLSALCGHSYILNNRVYDYIINHINEDWQQYDIYNSERTALEKQINWKPKFPDVFYAKIVCDARKNSYGIYPMICHQRDGFSDIENRVVSYKKMLNDKADILYHQYAIQHETIVINLDRRPDRIEKMSKKYQHEISTFRRYGAIDGKSYDFTKYMDLFDTTDYKKNIKNPYGDHGMKKGALGCALSHYLLWENLKKSNLKDDDFILILEDDIDFCDNYIQKMNKLLVELKTDKKWDVCFVGFTDYCNYNDTKLSDSLLQLSGLPRQRGGGTFAYFIRKSGAEKLFTLANKLNIQQPVDWFMIEQFDKMNVYKCNPELIFSDVQNNNVGGDTDVQNNNDTFELPTHKLKNINDFREVYLNNQQYFINNDKQLLYFNDEKTMEYKGSVINDRLVQGAKFKNHFLYDPEIFKATFNNPSKENIIFYIGKEDFPYWLMKYIEKIGKNKNVLVVGKNFFNSKINGIYYFHQKNDSTILNLLQIMKMHEFYVYDINFFMQCIKPGYSKLYVISRMEYIEKFDTFNYHKNNARVYLKNFTHMVDKYLTLSKDHKDELETFLDISSSKIDIINYAIDSTITSLDDKKYIICYDEHPKQVLMFYKIFSQFCPGYKMIIFNDNVIPFENVINMPRNNYNLIKCLNKNSIFITFENKSYTYFNIINAIKKNCLCILPDRFYDLKNKCLSFSNMDNDKIIELSVSIKNTKKMDLYKKIIRAHLLKYNKDM